MPALDLSGLITEATETETIEASASLVIDRLLAEAEANKNDPAAVQAVVDRFRAARGPLATAIAAVPPAGGPPASSARGR
jgi:hypothetical protein